MDLRTRSQTAQVSDVALELEINERRMTLIIDIYSFYASTFEICMNHLYSCVYREERTILINFNVPPQKFEVIVMCIGMGKPFFKRNIVI